MKALRVFLCLILILGLLLPGTSAVSAADSGSIIRELITYYCHYQDDARTDIERLLQELEAMDPKQGAHWRAVMDYWHYACTGLSIVPEVLPDGLPQDDSLCIVVFGFALDYNGTPKEELEGRLVTALASAQKYPNAYILCTGGGTAPGNPNVTEAGQMSKWLTAHGIAPERIITEGRSYSTEQNARYCLNILREDYPGIRSLALVSSDYHLRRCHLLFQTLFILEDLTDIYEIAGNAAYPAGYIGESGYAVEAEGLGILLGITIRGTKAPTLSALRSLSVRGPDTSAAGDSLSLTVTAHYDNGFSRDVTADAVFSGFDPETPGIQNITVSYTENGTTAAAPLQITVLPPPTEEPTEPPTTAPPETESIPTGASETPRESPAEENGPPTFRFISIPVALGGSVSLLLLLLSSRRRRGKYQK